MRYLVRLLLAFALTCLTLLPAVAQEDDKGFLTRTLQDVLSGAGRDVRIDGFRGALSSEAAFDRMTIADNEGVWLTLEGVSLVWNRSALLRGRLEVESLTADQLDVARLPAAEEDALPDAEAAPFSLPELPVSVDIAQFAINEINLGAPVLGEDAQLSIAASAQLNDDLANIDLQAQRTDAKRGEFVIKANFERSDNLLDLLLNLSEGEEGIAARLLSIPGQPSVDLRVEGSGPLDDFMADVGVETDGQERLAGQIVLGSQTPRRASDTPDRRIQADIGGDITAILAPRYREFFGEDVSLTVDALLEGNGAIDVSSFALTAQAAELSGQVTLNQDRWPTRIDIDGRIANPDGTPILLPAGGEATTVERVNLRVDYDAGNDDAIDAAFDIAGLALTGVSIDQTSVTLDGTLHGNVGSVGQFAGDVRFETNGLSLADAAVAEAVGSQISGEARIVYTEDTPLEISGLRLSGADYALSGDARIDGVESGLSTQLSAALEASDLSRFSALAGQDLAGQTALSVDGTVVLLSGQFDITASGSTQDLALGIAQADAVLAGRTELNLAARRDETGTFLRDLVLENDALSLTGQAELRTDNSRAEAQFRLEDIGLVVPQYDGPVSVTATAVQDTSGWTIDAATDGPYAAAITARGLANGPNALLRFTADIPDMKPFVDQIEGPVTAEGTLRNTEDGWRVDTNASGPYQARAAIEGLVAPQVDVSFDVSLPDVQPLVPQVNGPLQAEGRLRQTQQGFEVETTASGPYGAQAQVTGDITPQVNIRFDLTLPNVQPLAPQLNGPLAAEGSLRQTERGFLVDTQARGPYGSTAKVSGIATGPDMRLTFAFAVPNVNPIAPGVSGPLSANGIVRQTPDGIAADVTAAGPYSASAAVQGIVTGPNANVDFNLDIPNVAALVPQLNGPLSVDGSAQRSGNGWRIDTDADGPSGTQARVVGVVNADGTLNLDINGTAPLGLTRPFLAPRDLQGLARFDLQLNGRPALSSFSGTIQTSDASFTAPNLRLALQGITADVRISNSRAQLNVSGEASNGGRLRAGGVITMTGSLPADIQIGLQNLVLIDPRLYRTSVSGDLRLAGPLTGGAQISGQVNVGETTVNVPSTGITNIGDIPPITHIGATRPVISTRRKAGLDSAAAGTDPTDRGGRGFGLNLRVNAPNQIFVRGRGIDAELGGALTLTGTTGRVISAGRFDLLRGRLDILGRRFDLVEGSIQFQGDLVPFIRFVSATSTATGEVRVIVEGRADEPEVRFASTPEAPQDEVLAQLLFGRSLSDISAFQALQLANAVATLAGRGGVGVISNLREGFGLDDLDVTTTDDGATAVRAGKYISENVYTDVTAASDGTGEVSLNLDITSNLKGKATLGSDGNSGIGIFFEKDY